MQKSTLHEKIISTAGDLFYTNGYNSTGINEIINKCGIAKATLYSHFKSKEDICIAYLTQRHEEFLDDLKQYVSRRKKGKNQLLAIFDYLTDLYREDTFFGCWALKTLGELSAKQKRIFSTIQKHKKELLLYLGDVVLENIHNVSKAEVEKVSGGIYMLYDSAITEAYLHKNAWPIYLAKTIAPSFFSNLDMKS
ncbi:TetR/AcrR family transcriptional regulator [Flagellimonas meridianipacifica]|uniref:Regulatory TetR family protein n=1 Tax=Flagellimonas meridianipacifica TaxID=1080225 RepID=A0A2T0MGR3_9FLAO|nr:TetR/AcrR family transcriptional regulator [Allomuricauda pacifica]PRX56759.1 regulatory TetR family protein [Allomuricauda pacifica]